MTRQTLVLMYHAVPPKGDSAVAADPHYSVSLKRFIGQLDQMSRLKLVPRSVRDLLLASQPPPERTPVALTFDDGHESNFAAFAEIALRGGSADLFINPSTVGQRGFLSWAQLRELSRHGASIQSHGLRHLFLDELSPDEVRHELAESRRRIADEVGLAPQLFAPPNGRMPRGLPALARELGYRAVCSSRVGLWRHPQIVEIPRFAVLAGTSPERLHGWLTQSHWEIGRSCARAAALDAGKRLLGNSAYESLRRVVLRSS